MTEQEKRQQILKEVAEYCREFHGQSDAFKPGDRIGYAGRVYDEKEMVNLVDSALDFWLTSGRYTEEFEKKLGEYLDIKYVSFVNSGSSANLLAFMTLTSPLLGERRILPGDEVITVACGFPTTVTPIIQYGAVPVFCDVTIPQYNIDVSLLKDALSEKTRAVMLAHTLGNPFDLQTVREFCDRYDLWLIEDNCDALGSRVRLRDGEGNEYWKYTGTVGDIGTGSFYPPHHLTTGEGGAVYTNNPVLHRIVRSLRDWGRDCICPPGHDNVCGHRFDRKYGELPVGYDHKYVYSHFGYNLKATDMQAALGCAQLEKLPGFVQKRKENWRSLWIRLSSVGDRIKLPKALPDSDPSWFGFMITVPHGMRDRVIEHLEKNGIQTRMLFAGNLIKHPCFDGMRESASGYRVAGTLENTDRIMEDSFWVGVYPGMTEAKTDFMAEKIKEAINA